jgi:hypothetical protein
MANEENRPEREKWPTSYAVLWSALAIFIVLAIGGMWAIDYYFSPEMIDSTFVRDAVGK